MGLIRATKDAIQTVLKDQYLEFFYCDSLSSDVLMAKGQTRGTAGRDGNHGLDNIINTGSAIAVNEGQCMLIVDQGAVVEVCAEAGEFIYDSSTEPSVFGGKLGENVANSFKTVGRRIAFGGNTAKDQRVYFINTKEITNNLFGTATPIDFHIVSPRTGYEMETTVRCNGQYSYRISDPIMFYRNVCANVADAFRKSEEGAGLASMMKKELLTKLPSALSRIAAEGVLPYQVAGRAEEIALFLRDALTEQWTEIRGIEVVSVSLECSTSAEDREKINKWNEMVMLTSADMRAAQESEARAEMIRNVRIGSDSAPASGADAMMSMMAMNMMGGMMGQQNMNGGMAGQQMQQTSQAQPGQQMQQPAQQVQQAPQMKPAGTAVLGWTCSCGHTDNRGKFCEECGATKPAAAGWICGCGEVNQGKFCTNCGSKKPEGAPLYRCDKCGWEPDDPANPPKFCPECGDAFDENDIR